MIWPPPSSPRTATVCPDRTLFRSATRYAEIACRNAYGRGVGDAKKRRGRRRAIAGAAIPRYAQQHERIWHRPRVPRPPRRPRGDLRAAQGGAAALANAGGGRSEEQTSELQSLMRISYAVFCLKKKQTSNS